MSRKDLDYFSILSDAEIKRRKEWKAQPSGYKLYSKGSYVDPVQDSLPIGGTDSDIRELPSHLSSQPSYWQSSQPTQEQLDSSEQFVFSPVRKGKNYLRKTLHATEYQNKVNRILKSRGINPYEWEPYSNFVVVSFEEQDYLDNVLSLFPEFYT